MTTLPDAESPVVVWVVWPGPGVRTSHTLTIRCTQEPIEAERAQLREQLALANDKIDILQEELENTVGPVACAAPPAMVLCLARVRHGPVRGWRLTARRQISEQSLAFEQLSLRYEEALQRSKVSRTPASGVRAISAGRQTLCSFVFSVPSSDCSR